MFKCVLVLERETTDIFILSSRRALLGHVEEFFDCLEADFIYVDDNGEVLSFDEGFLSEGAETFVRRRPLNQSEAAALLESAERGLSYRSERDEACLAVLTSVIRKVASGPGRTGRQH